MAIYSSRIAATHLVNLRKEVVLPAEKLFYFRASTGRNMRMGHCSLTIRGLANSEGGFESSGVVDHVVKDDDSVNGKNGVGVLNESESKPNVDNGSGGGGNNGGNGKVLGGGGDNGGDGVDPEEEEFGPLLKFPEVMREIEARGTKLPSDMLEAAKSVGIRKVLLDRYLDLQVYDFRNCGYIFVNFCTSC